MRIRLRKVDKLFSEYIRIRDDYTCQKCGMKYVFNGVKVRSLNNLGVSHYYSRSRENTRFDPDNCILLCNFPCHRKWETEEREDYKKFMVFQLGQDGFDQLTVRANLYKKKDDVMTEIILKEMLKLIKEVKDV